MKNLRARIIYAVAKVLGVPIKVRESFFTEFPTCSDFIRFKASK